MNEHDEETLRRLPQILNDITILDRMERPNPLTGQDILIEDGPLDGSTELNDGTYWQGDFRDVEVDGVQHRYQLGQHIVPTRDGVNRTSKWFYCGHFANGALVEFNRGAAMRRRLAASSTSAADPATATEAPALDPDEDPDARLHRLVLAHLQAVGAADAEQQAGDFVDRVQAGRAKTPPDNDAQLWGETSFRLGASLAPEQRMVVARQLMAILRRVREPHRRTWGPGDELPSPPPRKMADLDWDEWLHQDKAGHGCYRMSSRDRRRVAGGIHDYEGVQVWPFLLEREGPFTEVTLTDK